VVEIDGAELAGLTAVELNRLVVGPEGSVAEIVFVKASAERAEEGAGAGGLERIVVTRALPSAPRNKPFGVVRSTLR
jgi:hypothetical protein